MTVELTAVQRDGFSIVPEVGSDSISVKLAGSCDTQTAAVLDRFLGTLHGEALRLHAKIVALDCENLYFLNAASVKSFVAWLNKVKALGPTERYRVSIRTNRFLAWHERSFGAIRRAAPDILSLDP